MSDKEYICGTCLKRFARKADRKQHWRDTDCQAGYGSTTNGTDEVAQRFRDQRWEHDLAKMDRRTRRDVFESVVDDDLPDGAYFAMAQEFGLEPEDFIDD